MLMSWGNTNRNTYITVISSLVVNLEYSEYITNFNSWFGWICFDLVWLGLFYQLSYIVVHLCSSILLTLIIFSLHF